MEETCHHDLPIGQCALCKKPPEGINKIVYTTKGGLAFHNDYKCRTLQEGQQEAELKGMDTHPINPTNWSDAFSSRRPCRNCCPKYKHPK